jgi:hypothetical protein
MGSSYTGDDNLFAGLGCDHASSLQAFLDECMEFHEKNEQERTKLQDDPQAQTQEHPTENESQTVALIHPNAMSLDPQQLLEEGTARAKIILERMKELTAPALLSSAGTSTSLYYQNQIQPNAFYTPKDFRCLREQGLAQEAKRKRLATFRNFEYLSKRHEQRAHVLNQQIEHSRQVQQQIQAAQQASLQARQARINQQQQHEPQQSTYSINSKPSFPSKKVQGQVSNKEKIATDSIALYISGLPTEEPLERLTSILNQLFTEFGLLKKIHLYRNKQTGKLKGDGLVIYNSQEANPHDLVERACAQVSTGSREHTVRKVCMLIETVVPLDHDNHCLTQPE